MRLREEHRILAIGLVIAQFVLYCDTLVILV